MKTKIAFGTLLTIIAAVAVLLAFEASSNGRHEREILELRQRMAGESALEVLELQKACAARARVAFDRAVATPSREDRYESHYNPGLRTCFVYITAWTANEKSLTTIVRYVLADAVKGREYATFEGRYVAPSRPSGTCLVGPQPMKRCDSLTPHAAAGAVGICRAAADASR